MPKLAYGHSAYLRANGDLPEIKLINLLLEASPSDEDGIVLLARAGLVEHSTPGSTGPVRGIFSKAGLFSGDIFSVIAGNIYRGETLLGTLTGTGPVSFATNGIDELLINAGGHIRVYNGATLATVTFPDTANVTKIGFISGLYIALRADTDQFYWSAVLDGTSWNALDFATAEGAADNLLDLIVLPDSMWLFGEETTEAWALSGDADLPFYKIELRSYQKGVIAPGCACELEGKLYWIGQDARPYSDGLEPIADEGLAERIRDSEDVFTFAFTYEGHPIFCVRLDNGTWGFDVTTRSWLEFTSYERANWRARCAMTRGSTVYLGDDELNTIWTFGGHSESGSVIQHVFTAILPMSGGALLVDNIGLHANVGRAEVLSGSGSEPVIEIRSSRDEGLSWTPWRPKALGRMGEYRQRVKWNRFGMFDPPGAMFEFRYTDAAPFRVSGLTINEPAGGRGR